MKWLAVVLVIDPFLFFRYLVQRVLGMIQKFA